ncbi:hypothetical protein GmHk_01G001160 [Glycine max]|nr:hypothetical protein GmHk_01G001160 [Glycine max]
MASRVIEHKLRTVGKISQSPTSFVLLFFLIHGCLILLISIFLRFLLFLFGPRCLWLSGILGSIAYNWSRPNMKTGVKIIHASSPPDNIFLQFLWFLFGSGCLWLSGMSGSIAYNWSRPNMKTGVKIIHASSCYGKVPITRKGFFFSTLFFPSIFFNNQSPFFSVLLV